MTSLQLQLLAETVQQLSLARDMAKIMDIVRTTARKLTGADGATFILKDGDCCYYADEDAIAPLWKGQRFPINSCISGWAMIHHTPAVIEDIYTDSRVPIDAYSSTFVKSLAMVPIRTLDPIGAIGNYWGTQHAPTPDEVQLLQSLADITSVSIENVYIYNNLEEKVRKRTEELELVNKELDAFASSVSHDLRAPIGTIHNFIQTLQKDYGARMDKREQRIVDMIDYYAARMGILVDDLLVFARLGGKDVNRSNIDMNRLVQSVVSDLNRSITHTATIRIGKLHNTVADSNLIYQVMFNLIANAVKYSSKKQHPVIEIFSFEQNGAIVFSVKDNGVGFDMQYAGKLFGLFQRMHSQQEFEGTGVGLALVQRIINKHGGRVWAVATPDEGATFSFSL